MCGIQPRLASRNRIGLRCSNASNLDSLEHGTRIPCPMAKKKAASQPETASRPKKRGRPRKLAVRVSDEDRKTKIGCKVFPVATFMRDEDLARLDAICEEYCINARTGAARYAIKRWHRYLSKQSSRPGYAVPDRPEFGLQVGRAGGAHDTKFYVYQDDMDRLESLAQMTDQHIIATVIRAAIGWCYENMDA